LFIINGSSGLKWPPTIECRWLVDDESIDIMFYSVSDKCVFHANRAAAAAAPTFFFAVVTIVR